VSYNHNELAAAVEALDSPAPVGGRYAGQGGHVEDHNNLANSTAGLHWAVTRLEDKVDRLHTYISYLVLAVLLLTLLILIMASLGKA
jgi:hypothetical protein